MFRPLLSAALAVVLAAATTACSDDADEPDRPPAAPGTTAEQPPAVPTVARIGTVTGRLAKADRARLRNRVAETVDAWIDAAYVSGDYPRGDFSGSFPSFTPGARARAVQDLALMSNAGIGRRVESVEVLRRTVRIDVLAPGGRAAGVTAAVGLGLRFTGKVQRRDRIAGELYLTRTDGGWKVFGYDVKRGRL